MCVVISRCLLPNLSFRTAIEESALINVAADIFAVVNLGIVHHVVLIPAHNLMGDPREQVCGWQKSTDMPP